MQTAINEDKGLSQAQLQLGRLPTRVRLGFRQPPPTPTPYTPPPCLPLASRLLPAWQHTPLVSSTPLGQHASEASMSCEAHEGGTSHSWPLKPGRQLRGKEGRGEGDGGGRV